MKVIRMSKIRHGPGIAYFGYDNIDLEENTFLDKSNMVTTSTVKRILGFGMKEFIKLRTLRIMREEIW